MTAICGGGTSSPKPQSPAAAFFVGDALENAIQLAFGLSEAWAAVIIFAAAQAVQTSTFCTTDPPTLTWPDASDIQYITTHPWDIGNSSFLKLYSVLQNGLWKILCQCDSGSAPTIGTPPPYPTGALQINPPGFGNQTAKPCTTATNSITYTPVGGDQNIIPQITHTVIPIDNGPVTIRLSGSWTCFSGTCNGTYEMDVIYDTASTSNNLAGSIQLSPPFPGRGPGVVITGVFPLPATATDWRVRSESSSGSGETITMVALAEAFCGGQSPTTTVAQCCPPDPTLWAQLQQIQQLLNLLLISIPTEPNSYASGAVHTGLHDNGTQTLTGAPLAIKVDITSDPPYLGIDAGAPPFLFDRGFIVPIVNSAPIRNETRLTYNPQMYLLPHLTEQIGYSLHPGVVATITELHAGP